MAKEKNLKLKEPEQPRKPKAPTAPKKPNKIIRKDFSISIPQYCHFIEGEEDDEDHSNEELEDCFVNINYSDVELKDCFVCSNGLRRIISCNQISFADLLKIRSKINAADEDIYMYADQGNCDEEIIVHWTQDVENSNYQTEMQKYQENIKKFSSKLIEHETKIKEYEHKLEEYKILKAEFIKQKAEQDLNSLLK